MISIREIHELPALMRWRTEVIENVFGQKPDKALLEANRQYYLEHMADDTHYAIVAAYDGEDAGCGALCFSDELPSPDNPSGHCAYLMNIYVKEQFRCKGIGHAIVNALLKEARARNCGKIYLETTAQGRSLYASLGFRPLPDMLKLH